MQLSETPPLDERWRTVPRPEIRRAVHAMIVTFVVTFTLVATVTITLSFRDGSGDLALLPAVFAFLAAGVVGLVKSFGLGIELQGAVGGDAELGRRVRRRVLRRASAPLPDEDLPRAARWASIFTAFQPLSLAGTVLNLVGILLLQVNSLLYPSGSESMSWPALVTGGVVAGGAAVIVPLSVRQIRRARVFAQQHQYLLAER